MDAVFHLNFTPATDTLFRRVFSTFLNWIFRNFCTMFSPYLLHTIALPTPLFSSRVRHWSDMTKTLQKILSIMAKISPLIGIFFLIFMFAASPLHGQAIGTFPTDLLEIPAAIQHRSETVIHHKGFTLSYNQDWKIPNWVAYELTAEEADGTEPRSTTFTIDPALASFQSATAADYTNSGFDRGHMAPAADMSWGAEAMRESFYTSNICPQNPALNRGAWKSLETKVREVAKEHGRVFVVCGPIVEDEHKTIGQNKVTVPNYFFKVLLLVDGCDVAAIGFIYPNMKCSYPTSFYAKSVDFVEDITGIDFFPKLPDHIENHAESSFDFSKW